MSQVYKYPWHLYLKNWPLPHLPLRACRLHPARHCRGGSRRRGTNWYRHRGSIHRLHLIVRACWNRWGVGLGRISVEKPRRSGVVPEKGTCTGPSPRKGRRCFATRALRAHTESRDRGFGLFFIGSFESGGLTILFNIYSKNLKDVIQPRSLCTSTSSSYDSI